MYNNNTKNFLNRLSDTGREILKISPSDTTSRNRKQVETKPNTRATQSNTPEKISKAFINSELEIDTDHTPHQQPTPQQQSNPQQSNSQQSASQQSTPQQSTSQPEQQSKTENEVYNPLPDNIIPTTVDNVDAYIKSERVFPEDYPFEYKTFVEVVNRYLLQFSRSTRSRFIPSEEQLRVLYSLSKRLLIESGAGTGKTTVIIIKMFLEQNLMRLTNDDILAITYTREGANSMRDRYDRIRDEFSSSRFLEFKTIHSYCLNVCTRFDDNIQILTESQDAVVYEWDDDEGQYMEQKVKMLDIVTEAVSKLGLKQPVPAKSVLTAINTIVEMCITNEQEFRNIESYIDYPLSYTQIMSIYDYYNRKKKEYGVCDYLDMLTKTNKIFQDILDGTITDITPLQRKSFTYKSIYVDEVQDISPLQVTIIDKLLKLNPNVRLTVIGDADQSIYSFRGASVDYIMNFPERYKDNKDLDVIYLTRNRRSAPNIISLSDKFIRNNKNRFLKNLRGLDGNNRVGSISMYEDTVGYLHRNIILNVINKIKEDNIADLRKYAVLYREHKQGTWLINYLVCNRIPFNINIESYSEEFVINSREFKDLIFLSHLLRQPNNPDLVKNYLYKLVPNITKAQSEKISFEMRSNPGTKLLPFVKRYGSSEDVTDIINLRNLLLEPATPAVFFKALIQRYKISYYNSYIKSQRKVDKMPDIIDYFEYKKDLQFIQNEIDSDKRWIQLNTHNKASITLNTFHISKGLEYENVFILPLSDDISPKLGRVVKNMTKAGLEKYIEEERRLLYVAITRAKNNLCIFFQPNSPTTSQQQNNNESKPYETSKGLFVTELLRAYEEVLKEFPTMENKIFLQKG